MSVIRSIGTGIAWNTAGVFIGKIVGLVNIFMILTYLSIYEYGLTELTMSVVASASIFLLPGMRSVIVADLGVERARGNLGRMKAIFLEYFTFNLALGIVMWALFFFGSSLVAHLTGNMLIDWFFKIVAFLFLTSPFITATTTLSTVTVRYFDQSFYPVTEEIAKGFFIALFFFVFKQGAAGLLFSVVCAQITAVILFAPRTLSAYRQFGSARIESVEPFWKFLREHRKWAVLSSYVGTFGLSLRLWLIKLFLGTETVGLFSFAYGILGHLTSFLPLSTVLASLTPRFRDRPQEFARLIRSSLKLQLWIAGVIVLGGCVLAPIFVYVFFPKYEPALSITFIVLVSLLASAVNSTLTPAFSALREQRTLFANALARITSTILFAGPLMLAFGLIGVGIELFVTIAISAGERLYRLHKLLPEFSFAFRDFFTLHDDERQAIVGILEHMRLHWLARVIRREN